MATRTFEQWIEGIYDHPVTDPAWYWADDADTCVEDAETNVECLTRLFTQSGKVLRRFDNAEVNQGFNLIVSPSCKHRAHREHREHRGNPKIWQRIRQNAD
jgi:hypothetical protein